MLKRLTKPIGARVYEEQREDLPDLQNMTQEQREKLFEEQCRIGLLEAVKAGMEFHERRRREWEERQAKEKNERNLREEQVKRGLLEMIERRLKKERETQ
jgi:hypothetical protein